MSDFLTLLAKIFPLYLIIGSGFLAARKLKVDRTTVASLLIYIIAPVVVFNSVATAPPENAYLLLPVIFFTIACLLSTAFYMIGGLLWKTSERNLLAFVSGSGNTGYFGLPLVLALFGGHAQSIAVLSTLGLILYETTVGYYYVAKSHLTPREALLKVAKLPAIYAFILGVIFNKFGVHFSSSVAESLTYFKGAYVVFGMMILGISLAAVTRATFDKKFTAVTFAAKFLAYPVTVALFIALDATTLKMFNAETHKIMLLLSVTPMATNTVTYATSLKVHPEKVAFTVMLSTLFALVYIPIFVSLFLK